MSWRPPVRKLAETVYDQRMKRALVAFLALATLSVSTLARQGTEVVDTAAIQKIRAEGLEKSQVMETMFWLTDRYGPRLTGSPWFEEAGDWAIKQLQSYGAVNARKERFAYGRGWILANFHATMTEPRAMPIIGMPKAWSPGTKGTVTAEVVRVDIANEADAAKYKGQLAGKIVLTQPTREVRMLDQGDGTVLRYTDQDGKWLKEALATPAPRGGGAGRAGGGGRGAAAGAGAGGAAGAGAGAAAAAGAAAGAGAAGAGRAGGGAGAAAAPVARQRVAVAAAGASTSTRSTGPRASSPCSTAAATRT